MERYFQEGLAPSTQKSYNSAKKRFILFCSSINIVNPIPVDEQLLCRFVVHLSAEGLSPSSIKLYLSAVRHLQISLDGGDPNMSAMPRLEQVIKGAKRVAAKQGTKSKPRLPITPALLRKIRSVWDREPSFDSRMLWAATSLCYFGFLRAGEITVPSESAYDKGVHLNYGDVAVDSKVAPKILRVSIKASKTDPFRKGIDVFVGRTGNELCPVAAVLSFMVKRGNKEGLLFKFEDGRLLTRERFVSHVRTALVSAGVDPAPYSGHSFRIGAATAAGSCGLSPAMIKMLGRWESSAYLLYIKTPRHLLAEVSSKIC